MASEAKVTRPERGVYSWVFVVPNGRGGTWSVFLPRPGRKAGEGCSSAVSTITSRDEMYGGAVSGLPASGEARAGLGWPGWARPGWSGKAPSCAPRAFSAFHVKRSVGAGFGATPARSTLC